MSAKLTWICKTFRCHQICIFLLKKSFGCKILPRPSVHCATMNIPQNQWHVLNWADHKKQDKIYKFASTVHKLKVLCVGEGNRCQKSLIDLPPLTVWPDYYYCCSVVAPRIPNKESGLHSARLCTNTVKKTDPVLKNLKVQDKDIKGGSRQTDRGALGNNLSPMTNCPKVGMPNEASIVLSVWLFR